MQLTRLRDSGEYNTMKSLPAHLRLAKQRKIESGMHNLKKPKFSITRYKDERIVELVRKTDHKTLAVWAIDCAKRVLPYFEEKYPEDYRPGKAIETLQVWINTGVFKMAAIRKA